MTHLRCQTQVLTGYTKEQIPYNNEYHTLVRVSVGKIREWLQARGAAV